MNTHKNDRRDKQSEVDSRSDKRGEGQPLKNDDVDDMKAYEGKNDSLSFRRHYEALGYTNSKGRPKFDLWAGGEKSE